MTLAHDITAPWSRWGSWLYDVRAAEAVARLADPALDYMRALPLDARLLDVGCGGGQQALRLAEAGYRVTGVDLSGDQIRRARRRADRRRGPGEPPAFQQADVLDLPFADGTFEGVTSVGSLKHWTDRGRGLRECARVLAPGGVLAICEVDRGCRLEDVRTWIASRLAVPPGLRTLGVMAFRTFVAGPSVDLRDAEALLEAVDLMDARAERVPGTPLLVLHGRRPLPG